ncbi:MAG TPA: hypothetical protein VIC08_12135 [Cellvibrionaceae bacterium]
MSINILSHYNLLNIIEAANPILPDLQKLIAPWHGERIRRIDRYIQLCLAGGLNCVQGRTLPADTGVYLASRAGAVTTSAAAMSFIQSEGALPKPLHFVNTLGNSAGYYLTRLLQVNGNTLVVSDEQLSFEAALAHAAMDLQAGRISTALVGGFDEVALPVTEHLQRLNAATDTAALYEGSHWLLLSNDQANNKLTVSPPVYLATQEALSFWLERHPHLPLQLCFTPNAQEQSLLAKRHTELFGSDACAHGVLSGAALTALVDGGKPSIHLAKKASGCYCAVAIQ